MKNDITYWPHVATNLFIDYYKYTHMIPEDITILVKIIQKVLIM